jgi:hypothetical protein
MRSDTIRVEEDGSELAFSFAEMVRYNGGGSPGGVAHAFKVLERALPLLDPDALVARRELTISTAFAGPGARDGFELVTRAVTDGRYRVDPELRNGALGRTRERFVFALRYRGRQATLELRDGFVTTEFIDLAAIDGRDAEQEQRLTELKARLADDLMAAPAEEVYDVT